MRELIGVCKMVVWGEAVVVVVVVVVVVRARAVREMLGVV